MATSIDRGAVAALDARVAVGEELTVTRYGKPVLKLVQLWAIDTNILVYATAPDTPALKQKIALELLKQFFTSPLAVPNRNSA